MLPGNLADFIKHFSKLPGIGHKTAERLGFFLLSQPEGPVRELADSIIRLKENIKICSKCGNIDETDPCNICSDGVRDHTTLCVVEHAIDVYTIESTNSYRGMYHVLGGVISPLDGITPKDLDIENLLKHIDDDHIREIIFATSPTTEGDTTMLYIQSLLVDKNLKLTNLARGIPVGTGLQYAGSGSLTQAIRKREEI